MRNYWRRASSREEVRVGLPYAREFLVIPRLDERGARPCGSARSGSDEARGEGRAWCDVEVCAGGGFG